MAKVRLPLHGRPGNFASIEANATEGATIGTNLFNADGSLFDLDAFTVQVAERQSAGVGTLPQGESVVTWTAIANIPPNVKGAALVTGDGFVRRSGATWSASPIINADLSGADTAGLAEGSNLYFTNARADARIDAWLATLASLPDAVDDAAAATAGVAVGALYRNGSVVMIRVA